jgi:ABC-type dipeptide/oligopeptide/nickel transport system permease subunit
MAVAVPASASIETLGPSAQAWRRLRRNPAAIVSGVVILALVFGALFAPLFAPYAYDAQDRAYAVLPAAADAKHRLGTDNLGQDIYSRLFYGARVSLAVGIIVQVIQALIGISLGLLAAWRRGWWDTTLMRITDAMFAFPDLLFAILLVGIVGPNGLSMKLPPWLGGVDLAGPMGSCFVVFIALALVNWPSMARLVRGQAMAMRDKEFVDAARAMGVRDTRIVLKHILPNILSPIIVAMTVDIANVILAEATLSFLGIGIQPPFPSWGRMIADGLPYIRSTPTLVIYPAVMLAATVMAFNFFGDALRDALDPRSRR